MRATRHPTRTPLETTMTATTLAPLTETPAAEITIALLEARLDGLEQYGADAADLARHEGRTPRGDFYRAEAARAEREAVAVRAQLAALAGEPVDA
jgi:hypothetical protein